MKQYVYDCDPPHDNADLVREQLRAAHRYRNKLVELELARREAVYETLRKLAPEFQAAEAEREAAGKAVEEATDDIKRSRAVARKRVAATPAQREALAAAKDRRKIAAKNLTEIKVATFARPDIQAALAATSETHHAATIAARADCGVYWGTYLQVEAAAAEFGKGAPPRYLRGTGEGSLSVQLQGGLAVSDLLEHGDSRVRVDMPESLTDRLRIKTAHQSHGKATIMLRIGSEGRAPIFAAVRAVMHRPLPVDGTIKWAHLSMRRTASTEKWQVRFVVDSPAREQPEAPEEIAAVHLGFRMLPSGQMRVATVCGSDGRMEELCLPAREVEWLGKADDLRSIRDKNFDAMRLEFARWLKDQPALPEWIIEATKTMPHWRSQGKLTAVAIKWRENRFDGDNDMLATLEAWRKQDKHLWLWHAHGTAKQITRRKDLYRCFVAALAKRYRHAVVASVRWKEMLQRPATEEAEGLPDAVRRRARLASPALLQQFLREKFGARMLATSAQHMSTTCHLCGGDIPSSESLIVECEQCGAIDQDHNAARVTLARGQVARLNAASLADNAAEGVVAESGGVKVSARQERFRAARERRRNGKQELALDG